MTVDKIADDGWELCDECYATYVPVTDPDDLLFYKHLHFFPEDEILRFSAPALHKYLFSVIGERWPAQLIDLYGLDLVRQTLSFATGSYGFAFRKGGIDKPAAYLRWLLSRARGEGRRGLGNDD